MQWSKEEIYNQICLGYFFRLVILCKNARIGFLVKKKRKLQSQLPLLIKIEFDTMWSGN